MTHKKKHHHHEDLAGEYFAGDAGQIILALLFAAMQYMKEVPMWIPRLRKR